MSKEPLLRVEHLTKNYPIKGGILNRTVAQVHAVEDVSFTIEAGTTLGLVGESGCGKSTIGRQIVGLEQPTAGKILYQGRDLNALSKQDMRGIRTELQMVFQDNYSALNPRKHIYEILAEPMLYHGIATKATVNDEINRLLELVGLPKGSKSRYPHEFSGGQRQRIGIARALSLKPRLIVCDEPVSALDVSIQAQILNLFWDIQEQLGIAYLFIGHGLAAVNYVSDRIAVMYLGQLMEIADADELFRNPLHPYTNALCAAAPSPDPDKARATHVILGGEVGSALAPPPGCHFAPRCPYATPACSAAMPQLQPIAPGSSHLVACPFALSQAKENAHV
ncbi:MAG: ABC transporter ATP-binding protein [Faecalibacterium sp.]